MRFFQFSDMLAEEGVIYMHERLREVRKTLDLSQSEFAKHLGMTQTSLSMMECGNSVITDKTVKLVCSAFSVNESWLRCGTGDMWEDSPHIREFNEIFKNLNPETQEYLLIMAKELLKTQNKMLDKYNE